MDQNRGIVTLLPCQHGNGNMLSSCAEQFEEWALHAVYTILLFCNTPFMQKHAARRCGRSHQRNHEIDGEEEWRDAVPIASRRDYLRKSTKR